jgi:chromosome segregation protein
MRVERIELIGFKSFADRTVFQFHPGITSIVGPNGCGKSNIVDAFKWVLGEQSAKSLRGDSMEDVIFAGSAVKKSKGMAEVTLVLSDIVKGSNGNGDNGDNGEKPTTISVTRRLFKSGESEYLMNKVPCRLKDIRNMFLDTGLELKAYSILEQGRIGEIVNAKPIDRRFLIEEVAGVMKYKVRKHEAVNKLESSKANLQRVQDIIAEVKRQINTIDRHAKKAERYKKLFETVKDIELRLAKRELGRLRDEIAGHQRAEETLKSSEAEVSADVHSTEAVMEERKRLSVELEKKLNACRESLYALERQITEDEGGVALIKRDCENLRGRLETIASQDSELDRKKEDARSNLENVLADEEKMSIELQSLEKTLSEKSNAFAEFEKGIRELETELEQKRKGLFIKAEEISTLKNEISHLLITIENLSKKTERSSRDIDTINDSLSSLQEAIEQTRREKEEIEEKLASSRSKKEALAARLSEDRSLLSDKESRLYGLREELAAMNSKMESLRELDRSQMHSFNGNIKTVCQVADIFETTPEYEKAIEGILGDKLRAAVVEGRDEIRNAIQYIREKGTGRIGFIEAEPSWPVERGGVHEGILSREGVIGPALNVIKVRDGFGAIAELLLQDVLLVDDIETALDIRASMNGDMSARPPYFVTTTGEVIEPSGMVFAGTERGVLKVKRLIHELQEGIESKKREIEGLQSGISALRDQLVNEENEMIALDGDISSREKYAHGLQLKLENLVEENERLHKKHEYISIEIKDDHREKDSLAVTLSQKEDTSRLMEQERAALEDDIRQIQETLGGRREQLEAMRSELTEVRLDLTSFREKLSAVKAEIGRLRSLIAEMEARKQANEKERLNINETISRNEVLIAEKEALIKERIREVGELKGKASEISDELGVRSAEVAELEKQWKEKSGRLEEIRAELNKVVMRKMELGMKLDHLKEDIMKTYSVDIETAEISGQIEAKEEEELPGLKDKLQSMGPVSLGTIEEYEELKQRHEFLTKQRDDLLESINALEDTIRKINRTTQKRLVEAFEALNEKFKEVFTTLFGKGRAELQLTEGSILDAGIEIIAQPPGKKLQNMTLLSGGEKALTALSLLFAGFMIKPTPLCILDEVDAPLDESNTERFIKMLKELSRSIQFINITHNRRTMEASDYIYGITMEEPGVSKVVSMHLAEAI